MCNFNEENLQIEMSCIRNKDKKQKLRK